MQGEWDNVTLQNVTIDTDKKVKHGVQFYCCLLYTSVEAWVYRWLKMFSRGTMTPLWKKMGTPRWNASAKHCLVEMLTSRREPGDCTGR